MIHVDLLILDREETASSATATATAPSDRTPGSTRHLLRWLEQRGIKLAREALPIRDSMARASVFDPRNVVMVADSPSSLARARDAGCGLLIGVAASPTTRAELERAGAHVVVASLASIPGALLPTMRTPRRLAPAYP